MQNVTASDLKAAFAVTAAVAEAIRELKSVPSGHLYARLVGRVDLDTYNGIIRTLKNAELVSEDGNNVLTWIGPEIR